MVKKELKTSTSTSKKKIKTKKCLTPQPQSSNLSVNDDRAKTSVGKRKRSFTESDNATLRRAEEVRSSLDPELPSFVKFVVRSHVSGGFWMGIPAGFCKLHLPKDDVTMTLVNENGEEYPTKYLAGKTGLSAGWTWFSVSHKLVEGDVLVFQLIDPIKFKVYIIRAGDLAKVDGALRLLDLDAHARKTGPVLEEEKAGKGVKTTKNRARKRQKSLPLSIVQGKDQSSSNLVVPTKKTGNNSEEVDREALHSTTSSGSIPEFKDMKNLESFTIRVNGFDIDSNISEYTRTKYYELCCTQKAFLHENLLEVINSKLVAGVISEVVNIADFIKASSLDTSQEEFEMWDRSLMAFEQLGMNVGFLRSRLQRLMSLPFKSELEKDSKRLSEAMIEQARAKEEMRTIKAKLAEVEEAAKRLEAEAEALKSKEESHELKFQAEVNAPW